LWNKEVLKMAQMISIFSPAIFTSLNKNPGKESYDPHSLFAAVCAAPVDFRRTSSKRVGAQIGSSKGKTELPSASMSGISGYHLVKEQKHASG